MRAFPLPEDHLLADRHFQDGGPRDPEACIVAEIAVRLAELKEVTNSPQRPIELLRRLVGVADADRSSGRTSHRLEKAPGFWLLVTLLSGDLDLITKPYREIGAETGHSKQNAAQNRKHALERMAQRYPAVAEAIRELHAHAKAKPAPVGEDEDHLDPDRPDLAEHVAVPVVAAVDEEDNE